MPFELNIQPGKVRSPTGTNCFVDSEAGQYDMQVLGLPGSEFSAIRHIDLSDREIHMSYTPALHRLIVVLYAFL